ncbi:biotin/lipoyl-binding carrier protein [Vineibacter terrae]|uniref:biotin/lipoyl-binding carrier protein n=1 Tax=Vineibacter terrae TaxID=2586908 RepID=UPI002E328DD6|nr:biotin/lipoyl-binding carrier protein [Vineibacter terrae]HEX2889706.1 biotin/lipoyl-binding carrier protein [Vineibacter terrae]
MSHLQIKSEIPGTVWKIEAKPGDELEPDGTLLILEAMKMEIPVLSPRKGRVVDIRVAEGEVIAEGQLLAVIEPT